MSILIGDARSVASAGATPYAAVTAGLAALEGIRHGGQSERVQALFRELEGRDPASVLASWLRRGERLPGFGHPLYPDGDPRARALLATVSLDRLIRAGQTVLGEAPNVDLALVAVARQYKLPDTMPITLFAIGRTAGWIAHVLEQLSDGRLIRPRARSANW
ncbi:MAG: citrate/2-methylcitrate synthase [Candidatus Xenobia bacterium]